MFAGISFGQTSKTSPVDIEAEEAALNDLFDKFDSAFITHDVSTLASYLTEDVLMCGTDPSQFWNKQQITYIWTQMSGDAPEIKYLGDREIKVAPDGNSATVVFQYIIPWCPKIPWRNVYHLIKNNDNWMILFGSSAFIPKNEDVSKLIEALD